MESAVIVGSILLAFGIDAGWDERGQRIEESEELNRLETEFRSNLAEFSGDIPVLEMLHGRVERLLAGLEAAPDGAEVVFPDSIVSSLLFVPIWEPEAGVSGALVASGRISLLRDRDLVQTMAAWESRVQNTVENQRRARTLYVDEVLPHLRVGHDVVDLLRNRYLNLPGLEPDAPSPPQRSGDTSLRNTGELRNLVAQFYLFSGLALRSARAAVAETEVVLESFPTSR